MALKKDVIQLVFDKGIETKGDPHLLPIGKLHRLQNAAQTKIGSFSKRDGSIKLTKNVIYPSAGVTFSNPKKLAKNKDTLLAIAQTQTSHESLEDLLYAYQEPLQKWSVYNSSFGVFTSSDTSSLDFSYGSSSSPNFFDCCKVDDNHIAIASAVTVAGFAFISFSVININTNARVFSTGVTGVQNVGIRLVSFNGVVYLIYREAIPSTNITAKGYNISVDPGAFSTTQLIVNDAGSATHFDCVVDSTNNVFYLAYDNATPRLAVKSYTALTSGAPATPLTPVNTQLLVEVLVSGSMIALGCNPTSSSVYLAWNVAAGLRRWIGNLALTPTAAAATITADQGYAYFFAPLAGTNFTSFVYSAISAANPVTLLRYNAATLDDTESIGSYANVVSRGAFNGDTLYFHVQPLNANQKCIMLVAARYSDTSNFIEAAVMSRSFYGSSYFASTTYIAIPSLVLIGTNFYSLFAEVIDSLSSTESTITVKLLKHELEALNKFQSVEISGNTYFAGATLSKFDGKTIRPAQGRLYPQIASITEKNAAAILTPLGTYSFIVIGVVVDSEGNVIKSAPSEPVSITLTGGNDNADVTFRSLFVNDYDTYYLYRTVSLGSTYYFDGVSGAGGTFGPQYTDAQIIENEVLYTSGGDLFNVLPPPTYAITVFEDRLFALTDDKIRYSKRVTKGRAAEFAEELFLDIETNGGLPTALAALNDKLLVFKESKIYYTTGEGPNDQGAGNGFLPIKEISSTVGAINQRTVLSLGSEVWFQSLKGYFKINAAFEIVEVGLPLDYFLSSTPVKSIEYFEEKKEIRITDGSRTYVFNRLTEQWGTFNWADTQHKVVNSKNYRLSGSDIYVEDSTTRADDSVPATMSLTTGWINNGMIQGLQRIYSLIILGRLINAVPLKIDVFYDYVPEVYASYTLSPSGKGFAQYTEAQLYQNDSYAPNPNTYPFQWEVHVPIQKCEAIRFTISDIPSNGDDSFQLVALCLEVGFKKGIYTGRDAVKA
jgi:hypothetical protein